MMDTTEGPCRMRKKLIRNEMFYIHYPFTGDVYGSTSGSATSSPKIKRINPPISKDSREFYRRFKHQTSFVTEAICGASVSSAEDGEDTLTSNPVPAGSGSTSSDPNLSPPSRSQRMLNTHIMKY